MSKANSTTKVLRVALKRIQTRWGKGRIARIVQNPDGSKTQYVCLIGSVTSGCNSTQTPQQAEALDLIRESMMQLHNNSTTDAGIWASSGSIPGFNDNQDTTLEMAEEVVKLAIIKSETKEMS